MVSGASARDLGGSTCNVAAERKVVEDLLDRYGETYAEQAGIRLTDKPSPLYQLLVLSTLLSARISADVAVAAAKELFKAGFRTAQKMQQASWQDRVDALGRGHYRRYDERTSTMLGDGAELLIKRWGGDLRRLWAEAGRKSSRIHELLTEFPGIGPTGADIFLREVQAVWPEVAPYVDKRVSERAAKAGLPSSPEGLGKLVDSPSQLARLTASLIRTKQRTKS